MSSTNKTPNLELSQLIGNDVFTLLGDYNEDMAKIDEAVQTNKENITTNDQVVEALGIRVGNVEQAVAVAEAQVADFGEQVIAMKVNIDDLHHEVAEDEKRIDDLETSTGELEDKVEELVTKTDEIEGHLKVGDEEFYFDKKDGKFGYNTDEGRGADTFHPFNAGGSGSGMNFGTARMHNQTNHEFSGNSFFTFYLDNNITKVTAGEITVSSGTVGYVPECTVTIKSGSTTIGTMSNKNSNREIIIDRGTYPDVTCTINLPVAGVYGCDGNITDLKFE